MKVIEKQKSLSANMREILLAMEVDVVETYWAGSVNHQSFYSIYMKVRKSLINEGLGDWFHHYEEGIFKIVRIK